MCIKFLGLCLCPITDQKIKDQCHGLVGRINGRFGSISAVPIIHLVCYFISFYVVPELYYFDGLIVSDEAFMHPFMSGLFYRL